MSEGEALMLAHVKEACELIDAAQKRVDEAHVQIKDQSAEILALRADNAQLRAKCKEHYDTVQKLLRYELRMTEEPPKTHQIGYGVVEGTGAKITLTKKI
jgi:cell division protein FtsB